MRQFNLALNASKLETKKTSITGYRVSIRYAGKEIAGSTRSSQIETR